VRELGRVVDRGFWCTDIFVSDPWLDSIRGREEVRLLLERTAYTAERARSTFVELGGAELLGLESFIPRAPKHHRKPGKASHQRARRINNLAKPAICKPGSPLQIRVAPPTPQSKIRSFVPRRDKQRIRVGLRWALETVHLDSRGSPTLACPGSSRSSTLSQNTADVPRTRPAPRYPIGTAVAVALSMRLEPNDRL